MGHGSLTGGLGVEIGRYGKFSFLSYYRTLITKTYGSPLHINSCNCIDCFNHVIPDAFEINSPPLALCSRDVGISSYLIQNAIVLPLSILPLRV